MIPVEFPKIETLFVRDPATFTVDPTAWRIPEFGLVNPEAWIFQEKIDGTNIRVMWDGASLEVGGRTNNAQTPGDLLAAIYKALPTGKLAEVFPAASAAEPAILFGEGYGPGIQRGGGDYRADKGLILFDVLVGRWWLNHPDVVDIAEKLGLPVVPVYDGMTLQGAVVALRDGGLPSLCSIKPRLSEGVVMRTVPLLGRRDGTRLIGKLKASDFKAGKK